MCTHIHAFLTKIQVHFCLGSCEQNCILQDFLLLLPPYYAGLSEPGGRGVWGRGPGVITPRPYFGRPIPVRGTVYAHHITTRPLLPDFQTFLRPCYAVARPTIIMQRKTLTVPKPFCYRILNWIETEFYEIIFQLLIYPIIGVHWNMYLFYICKKQI